MPKPIMGTLMDAKVARVGGKPKSDWTGLDSISVPNACQLHHLFHDTKNQIYRTRGMTEPFDAGTSLGDHLNVSSSFIWSCMDWTLLLTFPPCKIPRRWSPL